MPEGRFISLLRVSTGKQGQSGLGLEAQRATVLACLNGGNWTLVSEFVEVESGTRKGKRAKLDEALAMCRIMGASLIVANVSRLTRDPDAMGRLADADVEVYFCDVPNSKDAVGKFTLRSLANAAEFEAGLISERTKKALAAAKARGVKLGKPENLSNQDAGRRAGRATRTAKADRRASDLTPILADIRASGASTLRQIAAALNDRGIPTTKGGTWSAVQVSRVLARQPA